MLFFFTIITFVTTGKIRMRFKSERKLPFVKFSIFYDSKYCRQGLAVGWS